MITEIKPVTDDSVAEAKAILESGGLVGMPTETVYGLAAIGTDSVAVKRIYEVKGRPSDNPLIAHVHKDYDIDTLAIRIPYHEGCQKLLRAVDAPLVAPSANLSKHTSPVTAKHVYDDLNGLIPLILDGGKCSGGIESTVLDVTGSVPRILRAGLVTREMICEVAGACEIAEHKEGDKVKSPGVKYRHYRPRCDTVSFGKDEADKVIARYEEELNDGRTPYIMCSDDYKDVFAGKNLLLLGKTGEEIAANLYDKLLEGEKKADIIIAVSPDRYDGVYLGVMNRLKKACG